MAQRRLSVILDIDTGRGTARLTEAGRAMRTFGLDTKRASDNVRTMGSSFDSLHSGMQRPLQRLRDYVLILGSMRFALMNVRDLAVGWVAGLVKQSAELERLTVLMKGFSHATTESGKGADAQKNLRDIMNLANRTGFELKTMTDAFVKFQSADLNPQVYSLRGLTQAVAKFGGDSDTMHRAAIAIQQMAGKGVISMEELRQQIGEAVPSAMKTLAAAMGMTVQELVKQISKGRVAAKPALELMLRDMEITSAGAGERIANTMFGQIAQVKTGLMQLSADFTQLGTQGGFFSHIVQNLRELNETLRSSEAREAVRQLGGTIDNVANSIAGVIKFAIEWRGVFGSLAVTVAKVWLLFKAFDIGTWFARMGVQAVNAITGILNGTRQMTGVSADLFNYGNQLKASIDNQTRATERFVQRTQQRVQMAQQTVASTRNEIQTLKDLQVTYQQNINLLQQQRAQQAANLRTAQTLNAANVAMGRDTVASEAAVKAEQDALNTSTRSLIQQRRLLIQTDEQLAVAEEQLQLALTAETAATERATIAENLNTTATGLMATAARGAGVAIAALGEFMSVALGPIGLFIIACQQLAQWLNADRVSADQAADAMRNYVGQMANVEKIKLAKKRIDELNEALGENPDGSIMRRNLNPFATKGIQEERDRLQQYVSGQSGNAFANLGRQQADQLAYERQNYRDRLNANADFRSKFAQAQQDVLNGVKGAGDRLNALRDGQLAKEKSWLQAHIAGQEKLLDTLGKDPKANANRIAATTARLAGLQQQMQTLGQSGANSANLITEALSGKGNSTGKAAENAARRVGTLQGAVAGLEAQVAGDKSTNLQKFMATLAGGGFAGKSDQEIALRRREALLKDSVIDMRNGQAAADRYQSMMSRVTGKIAELNDELQGGKGNLAKFEAQLKAGSFKDFKPEWIDALREALKGQDEAEHARDVAKAFDDITDQMQKAGVEGDHVWASLAKGTFEVDQRAAQLQGRFAHLLDGLTGDDLRDMQQDINLAIQNVQRADAARTVFDWSTESQKILNSLKDENEARQANYELEVARQHSLINWAVLGEDEKKRAEIAFAQWKQAFQAQVDRQGESALLKQARDWYKLGTNIQGALAGTLSSFTDELSEGEFAFGKFAEDIIKHLFKIILQASIAYGILSALGMTNGQSFGSFMRTGLSQGVSLQAPTHHTGGVIGQSSSFKTVSSDLFANAFKYHGGGVISKLGPKEVPMIGLEGERVLTEDDQKALGTRPKVTVNVINNGGEALDADVGTEFNGEEMIVSVVLDRLQKQGRLRDAVKAVSNS